MVAALSPADINYDETLSTLRYVLRGVLGVRTCPSMLQTKSTSKRVFFQAAFAEDTEASSNCPRAPGSILWAVFPVWKSHTSGCGSEDSISK